MFVRNTFIGLVSFLALACHAGVAEKLIASEKEVLVCTGGAIWKTIGTGAAYGGAVAFVGTGIGVALAPAGAIVAPVALIAANSVNGVLIGAGSSAAALIYLEHKFGVSPLETACAEKIAKARVAKAQKDVTKALEDSAKIAREQTEKALKSIESFFPGKI